MKKYFTRLQKLFRKNNKNYIDPKTGCIDLKFDQTQCPTDYYL